MKVKNNNLFALKALNRALLCALASVGTAQAVPYVESGKAGDPNSWRSAEFNADWGLGGINAQDAYAAGYSGKGVKLGIFDQPVYAQHPEFSGANKVVTLVTRGIREYTDPYIPVKAGDAFVYDGSPSVGYDGKLGSHGTHVGGIAAGSRDGNPMHGVAYNAQIISADNGDPGPEDGIILGNDGAVYKAGWDALIASGARIINNSWGIGITDRFDLGGRDPAYPHFTVQDAQLQFNQIQPILGTRQGGAYDGAIAAARSGIVTIFAAGNDYNLNNPDAIAGLGYFVPEIAPNWMTVAALQKNPDLNSPDLYNISIFSSRCGYTASFCVSAPGSKIFSAVIGGTNADNMTIGYANKNGTSMAAPHVAGAVAVLMERFPYMTGAQVASVLRTTATDMGAPGVDALYGWGMINLRKGIDGPAMLVTEQDIPEEFRIQGAYGSSQFVADLPGIGAIIDAGKPTERVCNDVQCGRDVWRNDISGHGGLTKQGIGTLVLTGANTYAGPTLVNQGRLAINGSLLSAVTVNDSGILGGNGRIGALTAKSGGTVAPGNSIGTLQVAGDVTFEPGSTYAVELSPTSSDQIIAGGKAVIEGATVSLSLENSPTLLTTSDVQSLLGNQYNILQAAGGIEGRFGAVLPNYLFIGGALDYSATGIQLAVERNAASFASIGQTPNQHAVAAAAEQLGAGNPLYETLLLSPTAAVAQQAFQQLSGEIHPAIGTLLINDSRYLRDAVGERLRERDLFDAAAPTDDRSNTWVKVLGAWGKSDGGHDNASSTSSIGGLLAGVDGLITEDTRLGFVTGYSDSSLSMGDGTHSSASVDSYHLGAYLGHEIDALRLSVGGAYSWHRIDVKRDLQFGDVSGKQKSKRDATTAQLFTEAAYRLDLQPLALEPFANLAYVHLNRDSFTEKGDAAALKGGEDNRDAVLSTLGVRASKAIALSDKQQLELSGTLGWQHNLSSTRSEDHLAFANGNTGFSVQSVSLDRNAAVIGARAGLAVAKDVRVSLDYNGLLGSNEKDHGVGLTLDWQF
ncbi:autotransporter outer membrane beta-barrel domain-containing protein [Pseudomonas sp. FW306-1C-G01A]|uniref:autotransporter serine protease n=1 Tax=unclassified Pseudomonas TaxID=196821 RepID=UPI000C86CC46|nr:MULTISPECIES: autotransporter serine protease [unclassified Pseudomonas]PMV89648.1 autotransporter outer membrane beta-barrel domain-containing protein [Pseudomonas sp. GW101-1A09]PMV95929.1 autotransporter outer membrane beta-barrel domain-containing protein [Pseudomonas sp. FW306-2-2C-B10A]PMW02255.1 autotransporter outer membrane beta-barrel domain-containing protein [Pseudomonas sp. GW460-C8]PMW08446.1 autotransporter outer membrane beta-barrel domain-containing protein [Pseudomonas sp. 